MYQSIENSLLANISTLFVYILKYLGLMLSDGRVSSILSFDRRQPNSETPA